MFMNNILVYIYVYVLDIIKIMILEKRKKERLCFFIWLSIFLIFLFVVFFNSCFSNSFVGIFWVVKLVVLFLLCSLNTSYR